MSDLGNLENCKCISITDCTISLLNTFSINNDKEAGSLEYYIKSKNGALLEEISGMARTYVIIDTRLNYIIGYFSLRAGQCHISNTVLFSSIKLVEPGIELAMFAVNDGYKEFFDNVNFSFGEWMFSRFVLPKAKEAASIIGVRLMYIFALPYKPRLIEFYKRLGFINPKYVSDKKRHIRTIIPAFDQGCVFMFRSL